jgi:hypothetical protein
MIAAIMTIIDMIIVMIPDGAQTTGIQAIQTGVQTGKKYRKSNI